MQTGHARAFYIFGNIESWYTVLSFFDNTTFYISLSWLWEQSITDYTKIRHGFESNPPGRDISSSCCGRTILNTPTVNCFWWQYPNRTDQSPSDWLILVKAMTEGFQSQSGSIWNPNQTVTLVFFPDVKKKILNICWPQTIYCFY